MTNQSDQKPTATTSALSEKRLARSLGYPSSWHVVRSLIPHPISPDTEPSLIQDRIFAGDPAQNADLYYNHSAAFARAVDWKEEESGMWDAEGGMMLPKSAFYKKGDKVQVRYEGDGKWYNAEVTKVAEYADDIKYSVLYSNDNTYESNITEDNMRPKPKATRKPAKGSKSATPKATKKTTKSKSSAKKRKRSRASDSDEEQADSKKSKSEGDAEEEEAPAEEEEEVDQGPPMVYKPVERSDLVEGGRVIVDYRGTLFRATIRKVRTRDGKDTDYQVHYDGLKKSKTSFVTFDMMSALLDAEDNPIVIPLEIPAEDTS